MNKLSLGLLTILFFLALPASAKTVSTIWKPVTPAGYSPITWAKAPGIITYFRAPDGNGSLDFITRIYLPQNQIEFITATSTPQDWGFASTNFIPNTTTAGFTASSTASTNSTTTATASIYHNFAFERLVGEKAKAITPTIKFVWNAQFFNPTNAVSDLSLALKSSTATTTLITSGSRPATDLAQPRRMLTINNQTGHAIISDFEPNIFVSTSSDQALEGFAPTVAINDSTNTATARLFLGVSTDEKELVIYCSRQAKIQEASDALLLAGIPPEQQLEADGGGSAACGYNLPGQFFVEPVRMLPLLMGATTILMRGTATVSGLNVRSGPGTKYSIITKLAKGTAVRVLEEKNGWYKIGDKQWASKSLIKKISN